jgi:hypothetical protein
MVIVYCFIQSYWTYRLENEHHIISKEDVQYSFNIESRAFLKNPVLIDC